MMQRFPKWPVVGAAMAAVLVIAAAVSGWLGWRQLHAPLTIAEPGEILIVEAGVPLSAVARDLAARGALGSPRLLALYARLTDQATRIHAGEYRLEPGQTPVGLLSQLTDGKVLMHQFTIVEGWRFSDLLASLREHPAISVSDVAMDDVMVELGFADVHPEGQFLPDTYSFPRGTSDLELLGWAKAALDSLLDDAWATRADQLALEEPYQALIVASIIEKETGIASERAMISAVIHNRLGRGMRLQMDPTVIYGLGADFDGNLRRRDLVNDTPYNTYTRRGLPPTPIALSGEAAIRAAVQPAASDALYFVATGLGDGRHHFSSTLEEHNRAVREFVERSRQ